MMWRIIPGPIRRALSWLAGAAAFGLIAHQMGKRAANTKATTDRLEANINAAHRAKETRHAIETSDDQRLVDILSGVHRDGKR
jgi:hypothetical protein